MASCSSGAGQEMNSACFISVFTSTWKYEVLNQQIEIESEGRFRLNVGIYHVSVIQRIDIYMGAYKSLARPTSRCILFDGENISFDASLVIYIYIYIYIYSTNIPPIMIINRIYEHQNFLSL